MAPHVKHVKAALAYPSMFFAGLILLIPHRIGMSRVNYVIKRYNLPISRAGLLLYKYHNNIELSLTIGTLSGNIINWVYGATSNTPAHKNGRILIRYLMLIFLFFMLISSIIMFIIYVSGGDFGHLNTFYFSLIFLTLFDGFSNAFAFALNGKYSSMLSAGIPLSGFLVTLLHYVYKFFSDSFLWDDFDYYVLRLQLICNILILLFTLILWIVDQVFDLILISRHTASATNCDEAIFDARISGASLTNYKWDGGPNSSNCVHNKSSDAQIGALFDSSSNTEANYGDWSPIGMLAISLGTVYAFYPSIAPYSIIDFQYASVIELWILVISAIIPFIFAILDFFSDKLINTTIPDGVYYGPSGLNFKTSAAGHYLNWHPDGYYGWHCVWICAIFYILCIQIFMSMLHYPHSLLSSLFNTPYRIGFISVLFNTLRELLQACGFAGAGKQNYAAPSQASDKPVKVNTYIAPTNKLITLFVMMFCVFTGDGYLQHYRRCCDNWPTTGYNKYQSFFYWLRFGFKGGIKSITSSFTDLYYHNLRPQFIYMHEVEVIVSCCDFLYLLVFLSFHTMNGLCLIASYRTL